MFGDKPFSGFKSFIQGISKYLIDIKKLKDSIFFILTKGLEKTLFINLFS